ncbi:Sds3-like [Geosmithia morbida]|uniref:Sds3-like n=1 Tax=Geosmithia morbida TaxID=1094350 RepID=A0A9P4YVI3_9HYPO|nr:Sds3-like [Geosmithia morbida]KAF4123878.1 Sds3-like [Geosmithia morbida]
MATLDAAMPANMTGRRSPPPPTAAAAAATSQSKRDRKRQLLMERLASMNERFQRDKDLTYRDQLQKIQLDTKLIQRFDPYSPNALDIIADLQREHDQMQGAPVNAENSRSLLDMAGINFHNFLAEIEDLIEVRDFQLTESKNEYDRKVREYKNVHAYKTETARREHRALTSTLRDRLINTLTQKKNRLNREKEVLEINDSHALLLNPNQFSITNPSSPGGAHGKRATRLRKDAEDLYTDSSKKRKRNGGGVGGDDDGSPGPSRRGLDANSTTPLWQSEKARAAAKQSGPLYSIDKLFTDKELSLHYNNAAIAAHQYMLRNRVNGASPGMDDSDQAGAGGGLGADDDLESLPSAAPAMERQVSHATRSTRGATAAAAANNQNFLDDRILGIEGIANFEVPGNLDLMHAQEPPKVPPPVPQQYLKPYPRSADQNYPVPLSQDDIQSDLAIINTLKQYDMAHKPGAHLDASSSLRRVLENVAVPYHQGRFVALTSAPRDDAESVTDALGLPMSSLRDQQNSPSLQGGAPMSRQSSLGGAAMSRQGSTRGRGRRN